MLEPDERDAPRRGHRPDRGQQRPGLRRRRCSRQRPTPRRIPYGHDREALIRDLLARTRHPLATFTDALWLGQKGALTDGGLGQMLERRSVRPASPASTPTLRHTAACGLPNPAATRHRRCRLFAGAAAECCSATTRRTRHQSTPRRPETRQRGPVLLVRPDFLREPARHQFAQHRVQAADDPIPGSAEVAVAPRPELEHRSVILRHHRTNIGRAERGDRDRARVVRVVLVHLAGVSSRTRAASLGCTSNTRSPTPKSCWASR